MTVVIFLVVSLLVILSAGTGIFAAFRLTNVFGNNYPSEVYYYDARVPKSQAEAKAKELGGTLATKEQLQEYFEKGGSVCGWAYFDNGLALVFNRAKEGCATTAGVRIQSSPDETQKRAIFVYGKKSDIPRVYPFSDEPLKFSQHY